MNLTKPILVSLLASATGVHAQSFDVYIGAPGAQISPHGLAPVETFNLTDGWTSIGILNTSVTSPGLVSFSGTYHFSGSTGAVVNAGQFGGAGGDGQYIAMGSHWTGNDNPYALTLQTSANYFGFWWSAGDENNIVQFYSDGDFVAEFATVDIFGILSEQSMVESVNASQYSTGDYFGNPNTGPPRLNDTQPFVFVSIYADGVTFDEIRFDNGSLSSSGFESDNHTVYFGALLPQGTEVFIESIQAVPEPAAATLLGAGAAWIFFFRRRAS